MAAGSKGLPLFIFNGAPVAAVSLKAELAVNKVYLITCAQKPLTNGSSHHRECVKQQGQKLPANGSGHQGNGIIEKQGVKNVGYWQGAGPAGFLVQAFVKQVLNARQRRFFAKNYRPYNDFSTNYVENSVERVENPLEWPRFST